MTDTYIQGETALLIMDPYNDFMSEGGKLYNALKEIAESVGFQQNMSSLIHAVRAAGIKIFIVPHHRSCGADLADWRFINASQRKADEMQLAAQGTWGGEWHPEFGPGPDDIVVQEHWGRAVSPIQIWTLSSSSMGFRK